jgi:hypothetical protein
VISVTESLVGEVANEDAKVEDVTIEDKQDWGAGNDAG